MAGNNPYRSSRNSSERQHAVPQQAGYNTYIRGVGRLLSPASQIVIERLTRHITAEDITITPSEERTPAVKYITGTDVVRWCASFVPHKSGKLFPAAAGLTATNTLSVPFAMVHLQPKILGDRLTSRFFLDVDRGPEGDENPEYEQLIEERGRAYALVGKYERGDPLGVGMARVNAYPGESVEAFEARLDRAQTRGNDCLASFGGRLLLEKVTLLEEPKAR